MSTKDLELIKRKAIGRKVIVVEGKSDHDAFQLLFERKFKEAGKDFSDLYHLAEVGGKRTVLKILEKETGWIGIIDRDTWGDDKIAKEKQGRPSLIVLERYSIENYMIVPDELWSIIPGELKTSITGGLVEFKDEILKDLTKWLRHGVLWHTVEPLFYGLQEEGFHYELLEDIEKTVSDEEIRKTLDKWHQFLSPDDILKRFNRKLAGVIPLNDMEKLKQWIVGKEFFSNVVFPYFNRTFGQRSLKEYRKIIWENLPISKNFDFLWEIIIP
jgi:hypothetical protein